MKSIKWPKSFNTGNAIIDSQHKRLLECVDELAALIGDGTGKEVHAKCQELQQLVDAHSADEEAILRDAEFPRFEDHLDLHEESTTQFRQLCQSCGEACLKDKAGPCIPDITTVLIEHILRGDLDFKSFLHSKGLATDPH